MRNSILLFVVSIFLYSCAALSNQTVQSTSLPPSTAPAHEFNSTPNPVTPQDNPEESVSVGDRFVRSKDGMTMLFVPSSSYFMGSREDDIDATTAEQPQHEVTLDHFWIDETEVTNAQYNLCVESGDCDEILFRNNPANNSDIYPVVGVNWDSASAYCNWVGGRLPTEAEWEYAAGGKEGCKFPWGNDFDGSLGNFCDVNCVESWSDKNVDDGYIESAPVGSYPDGASWVGALDMAGNVWEWTWDWCSSYSNQPQTNPKGPETGLCKIIRGGAWASPAKGIRTSYRIIDTSEIKPNIRHPNIGFRCVLSNK